MIPWDSEMSSCLAYVATRRLEKMGRVILCAWFFQWHLAAFLLGRYE